MKNTANDLPFDVAAGMDNPMLNALVAQLYKALYPSVFSYTLDTGELGKPFDISTIKFDISKTPTVTLGTTQDARAFWDAHLNVEPEILKLGAIPSAQRDLILDKLESISVGYAIPAMSLIINHISGKPPLTVATASATGFASIGTAVDKGQNVLTITITSVTVTVTGDPTLSDILNKCFAPLLLLYLNATLLSHIIIPALQYGTLQISMPVPVVAAGNLIAYSALGTAQPTPPTQPPAVPANCVFGLTDTKVLQAAAGIPFPLGDKESFDWEGIVSGQVGAQVLGPTVKSINSDGSLSITDTAYAVCQLTLHTPWPFPDVSFGPSATATLSATAKPSVNRGQIQIVIESVSIPSFDFNWGIPDWIDWFFSPIEYALGLALNAVLSPLISAIISQFTITIMTFPTISFTILDKNINVNIQNARTGCVNSMLSVVADATITS
jgi:hypothetical protein